MVNDNKVKRNDCNKDKNKVFLKHFIQFLKVRNVTTKKNHKMRKNEKLLKVLNAEYSKTKFIFRAALL